MLQATELPVRIRTTASPHQCDCCPPDRVCAWACVQGASPEDIIIAAALALEGAPGWEPPLAEGGEPTRAALWSTFND